MNKKAFNIAATSIIIFFLSGCKPTKYFESKKDNPNEQVLLKDSLPFTKQVVEIFAKDRRESFKELLNVTYSFEIDEWYYSFSDNRPVLQVDFLNEDVNKSPMSYVFDSQAIKKDFGKSFPGIVSFREAFTGPDVRYNNFHKNGDYEYVSVIKEPYIYVFDLVCNKDDKCKIEKIHIGRY